MRTWSQIPKEPHGSSPWLAQRWCLPSGEKLVSASAAAAIYGKHPYISPAELAAELLAPNPPEPRQASAYAERGTRMEGFVMDWANEIMGRFFETPNELFVYQEDGANMIATLDGYDGSEVLEVKTTTRDWTGVLPDHWLIQGVQQAICANVDVVNWAIFDREQLVKIHKQIVTSDEKQAHTMAVRQWLEPINMGVPPEGVAWTYDTISRMYPEVKREVREIGPAAIELAHEYVEASEAEKAAVARKDRAKALLGDLLGDAEVGTVNGEVLVTWKAGSRKSLDQKALKEAHPDLVETYTKEASFRTMRVKGNQ